MSTPSINYNGNGTYTVTSTSTSVVDEVTTVTIEVRKYNKHGLIKITTSSSTRPSTEKELIEGGSVFSTESEDENEIILDPSGGPPVVLGEDGLPLDSPDGFDRVREPAHYINNKSWGSHKHTFSEEQTIDDKQCMVVTSNLYLKSHSVDSQTEVDAILAGVPNVSSVFTYEHNSETDEYDMKLYTTTALDSDGNAIPDATGENPELWPVRDMRMEVGKFVKTFTYKAWVNPVDDVEFHGKTTDHRNVVVTMCKTADETEANVKVVYDSHATDFRTGEFVFEEIDPESWTLKETSTVTATEAVREINIVRENRLPGLPLNLELKYSYPVADAETTAILSFKCDGVVLNEDGTTGANPAMDSGDGFVVIDDTHVLWPEYVTIKPDIGQNGNVTTTKSYVKVEYDMESDIQVMIDENGDGDVNYSVYNQGSVRSVTVITVRTPSGHLKININYSASEQNYEDFTTEHSSLSAIEYLESLVGNVQSTVDCSIYDLEAINDAINLQGETISDLTIEMKEDQSIKDFRALNDSYAQMITVYQQMTADIGATMVVSDKVLREKWMKEFERFTLNIRIMRGLVLDLTAVYKLENRLTVSFWTKLRSVVSIATSKVSMDIDKLLNYGSTSCNQEVVNRVVSQVTKLQSAFKKLTALQGTGDHTLENVMNLIPDGTHVSEIHSIVEHNQAISTDVTSLKAKLDRLTRVMSAKVTVGGKSSGTGSDRTWGNKTKEGEFNTGSSL